MKRRLWMVAGLVALATFAAFVWPIPDIVGLFSRPSPITPQEQAQLDLTDHPKVFSREIVTGFHRIGDGLILRTDSERYEFKTEDGDGDANYHCFGIVSPEDIQREDADPNGVGLFVNMVRDQAKQPIFLIHEDSGAGPEWILQQLNPTDKNTDGSPRTEECFVTPNNY